MSDDTKLTQNEVSRAIHKIIHDTYGNGAMAAALRERLAEKIAGCEGTHRQYDVMLTCWDYFTARAALEAALSFDGGKVSDDASPTGVLPGGSSVDADPSGVLQEQLNAAVSFIEGVAHFGAHQAGVMARDWLVERGIWRETVEGGERACPAEARLEILESAAWEVVEALTLAYEEGFALDPGEWARLRSVLSEGQR